MTTALSENRWCLRDPIPEIYEAADFLQSAVESHLKNDREKANYYFKLADMPAIRDWTESLWGTNSPYILFRSIKNAPVSLAKEDRIPVRMPTTAEKQALLDRDGYHCRFCSIPVIRKEIRNRIKSEYPESVGWESTNQSQHAAFQAMWVQYDHLLPHARGGSNDLQNMVITCAPCNYGRCSHLLEEVGLHDPRKRMPLKSDWDGLERFV